MKYVNQTRTNVINRLRIHQDLRAFFDSEARTNCPAFDGLKWQPTGPPSSQDDDLLPQHQDLGFQRRAPSEQIEDNPDNYSAEIQHPAEDHPILRLTPTGWNLRQGTVVTDSVATGKKNEAAPSAKLLAAVTEKPMEIIEAENQKVVPVGAGIPKQNDPSTPCKALMLPPDVQPNRSGPESLAVRLRCKAGNCVGCTVPAVAHQRVSGMGITSTAPARRKPSSFGSSLNRFANKCLLSGGLPLLLAPTSGTKGMG
jgi:hypothetical protein